MNQIQFYPEGLLLAGLAETDNVLHNSLGGVIEESDVGCL